MCSILVKNIRSKNMAVTSKFALPSHSQEVLAEISIIQGRLNRSAKNIALYPFKCSSGKIMVLYNKEKKP